MVDDAGISIDDRGMLRRKWQGCPNEVATNSGRLGNYGNQPLRQLTGLAVSTFVSARAYYGVAG
jgi:hypothetical protein